MGGKTGQITNLPPMNWQEIIARFRLQVDDSTELSSTEELSLLNQVRREVENDRDWEWLKAEGSWTTSTTVPYMSLPTDFKKLSSNYNWVTPRFGNAGVPVWYSWNPVPMNVWNIPVVFIGTNKEPYQVVPFSDRRNYRDHSGVCYIDVANNRLYFVSQPTIAQSVEFDYIKRGADLTTATSPLFNSAYHEILSYGMAAKLDSMLLTNKNESYSRENEIFYLRMLEQMAIEDANLKLAM